MAILDEIHFLTNTCPKSRDTGQEWVSGYERSGYRFTVKAGLPAKERTGAFSCLYAR